MYAEYTDCYYSGDDKSTALTGRKEMVFMANLCAFQFWQRVYKDKLRLDQLKQLLHFDEMKAALVLAPEEEWCSFHNLVQPSLNHVAEIYEDILNSVHRFRPKFLATADGLPLYYEPYEFQHTCLLTCQKNGNTDTMAADDEHSELPNEKRKCISVPFVPSSYFLSHEVAENLATIIKEHRVGGRTSEMSAVGLLPAALQGIDIKEMLAGASLMDKANRTTVVRNNPAALLALYWYWASDGVGSKDMVVLPYKDSLLLFSRYLQQLVMESIGKEFDLDGNREVP
ncbi:unnamed protein product [Camellia sinensis]